MATDVAAFDSVATDAPMDQILASALPPRRAPRSRAATERAAAGAADAGSATLRRTDPSGK